MATSTFQQLENRLDNLERKVFGQNDKEIDYPKVMFASKYKKLLGWCLCNAITFSFSRTSSQ